MTRQASFINRLVDEQIALNAARESSDGALNALLTKPWLMGVRRGWLQLVNVHPKGWPAIFQALDNLDTFVDNLEQQVLFVRPGPFTSSVADTEGRKTAEAFKRLRYRLRHGRSDAAYWQRIEQNQNPDWYSPYDREAAAKARQRYEENLGELLKVADARGDKTVPVTVLLDKILVLLRKDAAILDTDIKAGLPVDIEPAFKQFDLYGMKVIVDDATASAPLIKQYIRYIDEAHALIRSKGLDDVWYGTVFIRCEDCGGKNFYEDDFNVAGSYPIGRDVINVYSRPGPFIVDLLAHELGHRYWFRFMTPTQRAKFESLVKLKGTKRDPAYNELTVEDVDDVTKAIGSWLGAVKAALPEAKAAYEADHTPDWRGIYEKAVDAHSSYVHVEWKTLFGGDFGSSSVSRMVRDRFAGESAVRYHSNREREARRDRLWDLLDRYLKSTYAMKEDKRPGEWYPDFVQKKNELEVIAWFERRYQHLDRIEADMATLVRELYRFVQDSPHVPPVTKYAGVHIDEAFAEAFMHYVLGRDMTRDQIESFRSVLPPERTFLRSFKESER